MRYQANMQIYTSKGIIKTGESVDDLPKDEITKLISFGAIKELVSDKKNNTQHEAAISLNTSSNKQNNKLEN